jgi:hypothetical protein
MTSSFQLLSLMSTERYPPRNPHDPQPPEPPRLPGHAVEFPRALEDLYCRKFTGAVILDFLNGYPRVISYSGHKWRVQVPLRTERR